MLRAESGDPLGEQRKKLTTEDTENTEGPEQKGFGCKIRKPFSFIRLCVLCVLCGDYSDPFRGWGNPR